MKNTIIALIAIVGIGGLLFSTASSSNEKVSAANFKTVESDVESGAQFYDVRTPAEYASGHFPSSINFPLDSLQSGQLPDVAKDTKIYLQCQSGNRSGQATKILESAGFTNVIDLGGIADVQRIGGEVET